MAGITLSQAQTHLDAWLAADLATANGQAYTIGGRSLTRADAAEIRTNILMWERRVQRLVRGGLAVRGVTPMN